MYFYKRIDFKTDEQMGNCIKDMLYMLANFLKQFDYKPIKIYCGVKKGIPGQRYEPINYIGYI